MNQEKAAFFEYMDQQYLALTFDDVRMRTRSRQYEPLPDEINVESWFSRNVDLKVPFVSAAMDTVTTGRMAIAMAKLGGLGVVHAGLSIEEQSDEVWQVKRELNALIHEPVTVQGSRSMADWLAECDREGTDFRTFPVVNGDNKFIGLLTQNDFDVCRDKSKLVAEMMTPAEQVIHAGAGTDEYQAYDLMERHKKKTVPLLHEDGTVAGLYVLSDVRRTVEGNSGQYNIDEQGRLRVAAAIPTSSDAVERVRAMRKYLDVAVIDTADGDSYYAFRTLERLKSEFPELDVVVGNVTEGASAAALAAAGADGIKVGQGGGSICTTRVETGIGKPQLSAIFDCVRAVETFGIPVCSDGGIRNHGDISIAIAGGAHSVMMGNFLAGTDETPGEPLPLPDGSRVKIYRGMGSAKAMDDSAAARQRYADSPFGDPLPEGVEAYVPYKGTVVDIIELCTKALRKSMRYVKAANLDTHRNETRFMRITNSGLAESKTHDIRLVGK